MSKIILLCNQGLSTSALVQKMKEAAIEKDYTCEIHAFAVDTAADTAKEADVILIGPQVRYKKKEVMALFPDKPVEVIDMSDYGMLNGKKVLKLARSLIGD